MRVRELQENRVLLQILERLGCSDREALLFSYEEINKWPQDILSQLQEQGILKPASPAKIVECPGCEECCLMAVDVYPAQDSKATHIFISCDKREDTGRILIEPSVLEQWQIDVDQFVSLLAFTLGTDHVPDEIGTGQAFYLGTVTINRKRRSAIFIASYEILGTYVHSGFFEQYPNPFFLVAGEIPGAKEIRQEQAISLQLVILKSSKGMGVDLEVIENILSIKGAQRQDLIPFQVPTTTKWENVFISFANEQTVQIKVGKRTESRSFDEMGFSDARKAVSEPSGLWHVFRKMASFNGEVTFQDSASTFKDPEKVKKWVSEIRKKIRAVFPTIPGDPFHPYRWAKGYKTRFALNTLPSFRDSR